MSNNNDVLVPHAMAHEDINKDGLAAKADRCVNSRTKRLIDLIGSITGLVVLLPLFALIALFIYAHDRGPVFFKQRRTGLDGDVFSIWKFRTMRLEPTAKPFEQTSGRSDPRITPIGGFLRSTSLDELPQLLNVIKGEMSLVGPRPHPVALDDALTPQFNNYRLRQIVRPGLTGKAQIMGARGPIHCTDDMAQRLQHDLAYVQEWSVLDDIKIMMATLFSSSSGNKAF